MKLSFKKYILLVVLPAITISIFLGLFQDLLLPTIFSMGYVALIIQYVVPSFILILAISYPWISNKLIAEDIEANLHLFVVHLEALSTSTVSNKEIFESLAEAEEYGALTEELEKMSNMMDHWDMPLAEAARTSSKETPSEKFADFLTRLAHSQESGEPLSDFLKKERSVVIKEYETDYKQSLDSLDLFKEALISMMISALFLIMFLAILPIFTNDSPLVLLSGGMLVFIIMEVILLASTRTILPKDNMWHDLDNKPYIYDILSNAVPVVLLVSILIGIIIYLYTSLDPKWVIAISMAPLFFPGFIFYYKERNIKRCDDNYDAFMRSVSSSAATSSGGIESALGKIRTYEFGPLTEHIDDLYKRLWTRIDEEKAWNYFASGTLSSLITNFTKIYIKSVQLGGNTKKVSNIISDTFVRMVSLRKERYQSASSLVGVVYGLQVGLSLTLTLTMYVTWMMDDSLGMMTETPEFAHILHPVGYSITMVSMFILVIIIIHAISSSLVLTSASGSHKYSSFFHMIPMIWLGVVTTYIASILMERMLL